MCDGIAWFEPLRLVFANMLALFAYVGVIWSCFAFAVSFATDSAAPWGFTAKLNNESFAFAVLYMMSAVPVAFLMMWLYFIAFRARPLAIAALAAVVVMLGFAFISPWPHLPDWLGRNGNVNVQRWIMTVWAGATAALAHHVVFALFRPRKDFENAQPV
jgi:hypothetical protein